MAGSEPGARQLLRHGVRPAHPDHARLLIGASCSLLGLSAFGSSGRCLLTTSGGVAGSWKQPEAHARAVSKSLVSSGTAVGARRLWGRAGYVRKERRDLRRRKD